MKTLARHSATWVAIVSSSAYVAAATNRVEISSSGVPSMPRVFTSSRHGGTPLCMKNESEAASIQRWKFG